MSYYYNPDLPLYPQVMAAGIIEGLIRSNPYIHGALLDGFTNVGEDIPKNETVAENFTKDEIREAHAILSAITIMTERLKLKTYRSSSINTDHVVGDRNARQE